MTFEEWLKTNTREFLHVEGIAKMVAREAWNAVLENAPSPVATLPKDFLEWAHKRLTRERAGLNGFVALGNELHRAATYDRWIDLLAAEVERLRGASAPVVLDPLPASCTGDFDSKWTRNGYM